MRGARPRDSGNQWYDGAVVHVWKIPLPVPGSRQRVAAALYLARSESFVTWLPVADQQIRNQGRTGTACGRAMFNIRERVQHEV